MVKLRRAQEDALLAVLILECSIGIIWSSGDKYIGQQKVEWGGLLSYAWTVLFKCGKTSTLWENGGYHPRQHQSILVTSGMDNWFWIIRQSPDCQFWRREVLRLRGRLRVRRLGMF